MGTLVLKKQLLSLLDANDIVGAADLVVRERGALSVLIRISYDKETLAGWRAILAVGCAARAFAAIEHEFLRTTVRKLLWSLTDESGGIGWSAPELIGEIVSADPESFSDIVPLIAEVFDREEHTFRPGVMYALSRIAEAAPESVVPFTDTILRALQDSEPATVLNAILTVKIIINSNIVHNNQYKDVFHSLMVALKKLENDDRVAWIYGLSDFSSIQVGDEVKNMNFY